ncbi:MAG: hypothetical protein EA338_03430 [Roseinatronobacter sp.]|nr:MAG: hypothetical protein EA338_03430 [Roseinatronobacter sp.]
MTTLKRDITSFSRNFAAFPPAVLEEIVVAASDLCLLVTDANVVEDIIRGGAVDDLIGEDWIDKPLQSIVSKDSWRKLDMLWSAQKQDAPVWRHLNFIIPNDPKGEGVPLLVRRIAVDNGRSIVVCRDLRPSVKMQKTFNTALHEMVQSLEDSQSAQQFHPSDTGGAKAKTSVFQGRATAAVEKAIDEVGHLPLAEIVTQTAQVLEDICIQLAYEKCDYDLSKTADLLGISSDELASRIHFVP